MKKLKNITSFICSAIAAVSMLALAGCDLELRGDPLDEGSIMEGSFTLTAESGGMNVYFYPQYGSWTVSLKSSADSAAVEETVSGADEWWTASASSHHSTSVAIPDGGSVTIQVSGTGNVLVPLFEGNDGTTYFDIDAVNINAWLNPATSGTMTFTGTAPTYTANTRYEFVISRSGSTYTYSFALN